MTEKELQIYHTFLVNLEDNFISSPNLKNTLKIIDDIDNTIQNNNIPLEQQQIIKKIINDCKNKYKSNADISESISIEIRKERKKYDQDYFNSLFNGKQDSLTENLSNAKEFFEKLQEDDPSYTHEAINIMLKSFKNLPNALGLTHTYGKQYIATPEQNKYIQKAYATLNEILQSNEELNETTKLKLVQKETPKKEYCLRHMDRMLFNGFISINSNISNKACSLSAFESIKLLINTPRYKNNPNAQIIIDIMKKTLKANPKIKTYPELMQKICKQYIDYISQKPNSPKNNNNINIETLKIPFTYPNHQTENKRKNKYHKKHTNNQNLTKCFDLDNNAYQLEPGYRDKYIEKIENNHTYIKAICNGIENHLLTFCENNNIDPKIVYAGFATLKYYQNHDGTIEEIPSSHVDIYNWLKTLQQTKEQETNKKIFSLELHHDKERISFSDSPNEDQNNFILTTYISKDILLILANRIKEHHSQFINTQELEKSINEIKKLEQDNNIPDIHSQIFHACDLEIITNNKSYNYFITPETQDTPIIACFNTRDVVYKDTDGKTPSDITRNEKKFLQAFRNKGR